MDDISLNSKSSKTSEPYRPYSDLIGNKIADRNTQLPKTLAQNNLETVTDQHDTKTPKDIYLQKKD